MDKKEILKQLEAHFGEKPKYMGAPSFAYRIEVGDEIFTIDREGKIKDSEGAEIELEKLVNGESEAATLETEIPLDGMEVIVPMEGHTGITLKNLINMISSKQSLIKKAFELEDTIIEEGFVKVVNKKGIITIEDFSVAVLEIGTEKWQGITFDFEQGTIRFNFYKGELEPDKVKAYTDLVVSINENAKIMKHASSKKVATDNPKYSFRTWLLRLGMVGNEYKTTRKILLTNLEGNGAFRRVDEKNE